MVSCEISERRSVITQASTERRNLLIACENHPTFARCDRFTWVKAEATRVAKRTRVLSMIPSAESAGGVFNNPEVVTLSNLQNGIHVRAQAEKMYGNNADGLFGNQRLDLGGIDIKRFEIDV